MKHDYNQRKQNRIQSAQQNAIKAESQSEQVYNQATQMARTIPMGQPILVGHHSEKRDRNFRNRIDQKFGKAFGLMDKAAYYKDKVKTIAANDANSSDDPQVLEKLRSKLTELEAKQHFMKEANHCIKKQDRERFLKLPQATPEIWEEVNKTGVMGNTGFAGFELRNNNANIGRIKKRIAGLEKQHSRPAVDQVINGVRILENREANRLQMLFDGKPAAEVIHELKRHGFRWCRTEGAWQRHISNTAYHYAREIAQKIQR